MFYYSNNMQYQLDLILRGYYIYIPSTLGHTHRRATDTNYFGSLKSPNLRRCPRLCFSHDYWRVIILVLFHIYIMTRNWKIAKGKNHSKPSLLRFCKGFNLKIPFNTCFVLIPFKNSSIHTSCNLNINC